MDIYFVFLKIVIVFNNLSFWQKLDIYSKKVKLLINLCNHLIKMIDFKRRKKNRSKNSLFNPYKNGISSYDLAYLSSKKIIYKNKTPYIKDDSKEDYFAA